MSAVQVRDGLSIDQVPEWSGSALQKRQRRFNSGSGLQAPVARAERHRSSKSANAGSSSLELHFITRRVNWAGAQRRLLSDRPAHRRESCSQLSAKINAGMAYWGACLAPNQEV